MASLLLRCNLYNKTHQKRKRDKQRARIGELLKKAGAHEFSPEEKRGD